MLKRIIIVVVICGIVGGVLYGQWFGKQQMNAFFANMPIPPATITAAAPEQQRWPQVVEAVGSLVAAQSIDLTTEVAGTVTKLGFDSGDAVEVGQLLVQLDARTDIADLGIRKAELKQAEVTLERAERVYKQNGVSKADLDRARSLHAQAIARRDAQQVRVDQKRVVAPFSGKLGIRQVSLGQYLAPGTAVAKLTQIETLFVDFSLPEQQLVQVKVGQLVNLRVDLFPAEKFQGRVTAIDSQVDLQTRNFRVRAALENADGRLHPGVYAKVSLAVGDEQPVLAVPKTAVKFSPYGNSVFVITEQTGEDGADPKQIATQRFIRTGMSRGDYVAISDGLAVGEQVVTSGLFKLRNGQPVIISNDLAPKTSLEPTPPNG